MSSDRPKRGYCGSCGGAYFTLGMNSRWVPHRPECPRNPYLRGDKNVEAPAQPLAPGSEAGDGGTLQTGAIHNPMVVIPSGRVVSRVPRSAPAASTQSQDAERRALSRASAPFPVRTDDEYLIATHRERGAPWDCPPECGCSDREHKARGEAL